MSIARTIKLGALRIFRGIGLFAVARHLTRRRLRILCYHGFSRGDQHEFAPLLFMREATFRRRMDTLRRLGFDVIALDQAVGLLRANSVRHSEVVITIDDGWKTTHSIAAPVLREYGFPATIYVTTYYSARQAEVFNVVVWYMLWKSRATEVKLTGLHPALDGTYDLNGDRRAVGIAWIAAAERNFTPEARRHVLVKLADALGLNGSDVLEGDRFKLMSPAEVAALANEYGLAIELHTHRHRLPAGSAQEVRTEIEDNRRLLEAWIGAPCRHFCYPSGVYAPQHPAWLAQAGVVSGTTCDAGLNDSKSQPMLLRRYLDREDWTDVEFEAAISGFSELSTSLRCAWRRRSDSTELTG